MARVLATTFEVKRSKVNITTPHTAQGMKNSKLGCVGL